MGTTGEEMEWVDGSADWISDESSFYGDDNTRTQLEDSISHQPLNSSFWQIQPHLLSTIAFRKSQKLTTTTTLSNDIASPRGQSKDSSKGKGKARLFHPHEGNLTHRQSHEPASDFLARLPPTTTTIETISSAWIWVDNPHIDHDGGTGEDTDLLSENSAKNLDEFRRIGNKIISDFRTYEVKVRNDMPGKTESSIGRRLGPKRRELENEIKKAAKKSGVVGGKWMLFPFTENIDQVWKTVCEGVIDGRLGPVAKVAAAGAERDEAIRLICVYTKDFSDVVDVKRVLDALVELGLVDPEAGSGIYYKCDAYTYLRIESGNEFKLKASMYSSKEMLKKRKQEDDEAKGLEDEVGKGGKRKK